MWLILQNDKPEDFVIATGEQHSVREFCQLAFRNVGIELAFTGEGLDEKGIDKATGKVLIEVSPDFYRPTDVVNLWATRPRPSGNSAGTRPRQALKSLCGLWLNMICARSLWSAPRSISAATSKNTSKKALSNKPNKFGFTRGNSRALPPQRRVGGQPGLRPGS